MATTTLTGVNTPPAQTWNYLHINSIDLEVPQPNGSGHTAADALEDIEMGAGPEASAWIDAAATTDTLRVVKQGDKSSRLDVPLCANAPVSATDLIVDEGATAHVVVSASADEGTLAHNLRINAAAGAHVLVDLSRSARTQRSLTTWV